MFEDDLVPLLLGELLGTVKGKTRFQKLVFLIQDEAALKGVEGSSFNYELAHYGPFSSDLSTTLEELGEQGLLKEETEVTPTGYTRYLYSITDKGKRLLQLSEDKALLSKELTKIIRDVADKYGDVSLSKVIEEAYTRYKH